MKSGSNWRLGQETSIQDMEALIQNGYVLQRLNSVNQQVTLLDSYDWDIWQSGMLLLDNGNKELRLFTKDDHCLASCQTTEEKRFWWQLPAGELANRLKELISIRALTPKHTALIVTEYFTVLNEDDKIVVRAELISITVEKKQPCRFLKILPLKGYQREYTQLLKSLAPLNPEELTDSGLRNLLQQAGLEAHIPKSKAIFNLEDHETAEIVVARMAKEMIQLAREQEQGIIDDIDTEFVHQYRVNIRKTRSLISLFKKTLSPQRFQFLKSELKTIGSRTNELRDLDVFLLDQDYYRDLLPQNLWPGLEQLFRRIKRRRTSTYKKMKAQLSGSSYLDQVDHLLQVLQQDPDLQTKQARSEIKSLVSRKISAQYRLIQADGRRIGVATPDAAVHELRIECKKLRYLLELFKELYSKDEIRELIKFLKVLQDNLGKFNDYSVQQEFLLHFGQGARISADQLASINGLAAVLYNKQRVERSLVVKNISGFLEPSIEKLFLKLFHSTPPEGTKS